PEKGEVVPAEDAGALAAAMVGFAARARMRAEEPVRREAASFFRLDNVVAQHAAMLEGLAWRGDVVRG
ncbi:MAG: hypothetical protein VX309_05870, partial [Pseudomonadota bacterium]|nr:hypothetical protein [Pseudomonadota bacterium]